MATMSYRQVPLLDPSWTGAIGEEFEKDYMRRLLRLLDDEVAAGRTIYPGPEQVFEALKRTSLDAVKVVLLGQDPYHGPGQAHGLSFSVRPGVRLPPSLRNIYKEMSADLGCPQPDHGCLEAWSGQGVLLLNTVLTVEAQKAGSHRGRGWERFTDAVIEAINDRKDNVVFLAWGNDAKAKVARVDPSRHHVVTAAHPSPLAAWKGFFGTRPFSAANAFLERTRQRPIRWT